MWYVGSRLNEIDLKDLEMTTTKFNRENKKMSITKESILEAVDNNEFLIHYQPIYNLEGHSVHHVQGVEALLRWEKPGVGIVPPLDFLGVAERTQAIIPLGHWILENACVDFSKLVNFHEKGSELSLHINVSPAQFDDPGFFVVLDNSIEKYSLRCDQIVLEITEGLLPRPQSVKRWAKECVKRGYKISLDDFGTGNSSLNYLTLIEVDNLKIDRSFVKEMTNRKSFLAIKSILQIAKNYKLSVIAEGIEDQDQLDELQKMGSHGGQGFHFSKPLPIQILISKFLRSNLRAA
jgi:EAL domain-containing protein (putative c-di-GMP-specific phosphodiesterase class I)